MAGEVDVFAMSTGWICNAMRTTSCRTFLLIIETEDSVNRETTLFDVPLPDTYLRLVGK